MTENEAISVLKYLNFCGLCTTGPCGDCERKLAKEAALSALEEIQQYRAIGTPDKLRAAMAKQTPADPHVYSGGYACPGCGVRRNIAYKYRYCPDCGQRMS